MTAQDAPRQTISPFFKKVRLFSIILFHYISGFEKSLCLGTGRRKKWPDFEKG